MSEIRAHPAQVQTWLCLPRHLSNTEHTACSGKWFADTTQGGQIGPKEVPRNLPQHLSSSQRAVLVVSTHSSTTGQGYLTRDVSVVLISSIQRSKTSCTTSTDRRSPTPRRREHDGPPRARHDRPRAEPPGHGPHQPPVIHNPPTRTDCSGALRRVQSRPAPFYPDVLSKHEIVSLLAVCTFWTSLVLSLFACLVRLL